jgi:uncharacterized damage-inducible protein DinB
MASTAHHVTFDCRDAYAQATWWAQALGGRVSVEDAPGDPEALVLHRGTPLLFVTVPEGKQAKNRVHLDLQPSTTRAEEVERLVGLGATVVAARTTPEGRGWVVLADPEGNELCVEASAAERGRPPRDEPDRPLPPVHTGTERELLEAMLDWYREGVLRKVDGIEHDDAVAPRVRSGTTIAGLVNHLALVEDSWFTERVGRGALPAPWDTAAWDDDRDWEFSSADDLGIAVERYRAACERSRAVQREHDLDEVGRFGNRDVSVRFVLLHMVEETARHLGHLDVLCEQADGRTGE